MNQERQQPKRTLLEDVLIRIAALLCFFIGFWHTVKGLKNFKAFDSLEYGSYILASMVFIFLFISYNRTLQGKKFAFLVYLVCITINAICNFNWFYPNYTGKAFIHQELREHDKAFIELKEAVEKKFKDANLDAFIVEINGMRKQLQDQIRDGGFGQRAEDHLQRIENKLMLDKGTITRLELGNDEKEWESNALKYEEFINDQLSAYLRKNKYSDKTELMKMANDYQKKFSEEINNALNEKDMSRPPSFVENIIKAYNEICKKAVALSTEESMSHVCKENYYSANAEIGEFSHTFKSFRKNFPDGNTIAALLTVFFIDYFFPLALYLLTKPKTVRRDGGWTVGEKNMPTPAR